MAAEAGLAESHARGALAHQFVNWILGCVLIYASLFGIGKLVLKEWLPGMLFTFAAIAAGVLITRNLRRAMSEEKQRSNLETARDSIPSRI